MKWSGIWMMKEDHKKAKKPYFDEEVTQAIVKYNNITDSREREKLLVDIIKPAFSMLAVNIIHIRKIYKTGYDIKTLEDDTVSHLCEILGKYDVSKRGRSGAFSFFNVVARNHIIQRADAARKYDKQNCSLDEKEAEISAISVAYYDKEQNDELKEFINVITEDCKEWVPKRFKKDRDYRIAMDILFLLEKYQEIEIHNRKQVFLYLREMTNESSKKIADILSLFRTRYEKNKKRYFSNR